MKSVIPICILCLALSACRHVESEGHLKQVNIVEPENRSTEAEIRQHIVGDWTSNESAHFGYLKMIIADDGRLIGVLANGRRELMGTWECQGQALRVTPSSAKIEASRAAGLHLNEWDYYPVIYADAHELILAPGISVAGRWKFAR